MSTPFPSAPMASPVVTAHPAAAPRSAPAPAAAKPATKTTPKRPPLMAQPRVQRVVYPVLVGLVLIALWQGLVTAMAVAGGLYVWAALHYLLAARRYRADLAAIRGEA